MCKRKVSFTQFFRFEVGLSDGTYHDDDNSWIGDYSNSYAISTDGYYHNGCWLAGATHNFGLPEGAIRPRLKSSIDANVFGCGLVLDCDDKLWIFFTLNGKLLGELALRALRISKHKSYVYFQLINLNTNYN
jgi:hypothetical protein